MGMIMMFLLSAVAIGLVVAWINYDMHKEMLTDNHKKIYDGEETTKNPGPVIDDFSCVGKVSNGKAYFPSVRTNCVLFHSCEVTGDTFKHVIYICREGARYNPVKKYCDNDWYNESVFHGSRCVL